MAVHRSARADAEAHAKRRRIIELSGDCASSADGQVIATGHGAATAEAVPMARASSTGGLALELAPLHDRHRRAVRDRHQLKIMDKYKS
jgi:hypothetical protein